MFTVSTRVPRLVSALLAGSLASLVPGFAANASSPPTASSRNAPRTETIDLAARGRIVLTVPAGWTLRRDDPARPFNLTFEAPPGVNATATLTFGFPEEGRLATASAVRAEAQAMGDEQAAASLERRTVLQTFRLRAGYGYFSSFTDPKLVGQPPVPGDYKTITVGILRLGPGVVGVISLLCDDLGGPEFLQFRAMVEALELLGPGRAR